MLSTKNVPDEKIPFEIFSEAEINQINTFKYNSELQTLVNKLIQVINNGIHNKRVSWHNLISLSHPSGDNSEEALEIKNSAKRYLETANKLQKPKEGMIERLTLPASGKVFEKHAHVYHAFWEGCREALISNFLVDVSKKTPAELSDGKDKIYLYIILQLKNITLDTLSLSNESIKKLQNEMDAVIRGIISKTKLPTTFQLDKEEKNESQFMRKQILERISDLLCLQKEFESNPFFARYVHIRPSILIQFAQLIDYVSINLKKIIASQNTFFFITDKDKEKNKFILELLNTKHKEIADMLAFHEKLLITFETDDFIETLSRLVQNTGTQLLPTKKLFEFDKSQVIQIVKYDKDESDAPKQAQDLHAWRMDYLTKHGYPPIGKIQLQPQKLELVIEDSKNEIIETQTISLVQNLKPISLSISSAAPALILEKKSPESNKPLFQSIFQLGNKNPSSQSNVLYDFFIQGANKRKEILAINNYAKLIQFLLRQVEYQGKISFLSDFNDSKKPSFTQSKSSITYLENLIFAIKIFRDPYQQEIMSAKNACKYALDDQQKIVLNYYINTINTARDSCRKNFKKILSYWIDQLNDIPSVMQPNLTHLYDLMGNAVSLLDDPKLKSEWESMIQEKNLHSTGKQTFATF